MRLRPLARGVTAALRTGAILAPAALATLVALAAPAAHAGPPTQAQAHTQVRVQVRALAHAALKSIEPAHGATLAQAPAEVVLTFNERVDARFTKVRVAGPDGVAVSAGAVRVDGPVVAQPLGALTRQGLHTVAFRTVSADGHLISGRRTFTYTGATGTGGTSGSSATEPGTGSASGATRPVAESAQTAVTGSSRTSLLTVGAAGAGLAAALATAVLLGLRRRRHDG